MRKTYDTIGNRTRDLPACSAVPRIEIAEVELLRSVARRTLCDQETDGGIKQGLNKRY